MTGLLHNSWYLHRLRSARQQLPRIPSLHRHQHAQFRRQWLQGFPKREQASIPPHAVDPSTRAINAAAHQNACMSCEGYLLHYLGTARRHIGTCWMYLHITHAHTIPPSAWQGQVEATTHKLTLHQCDLSSSSIRLLVLLVMSISSHVSQSQSYFCPAEKHCAVNLQHSHSPPWIVQPHHHRHS